MGMGMGTMNGDLNGAGETGIYNVTAAERSREENVRGDERRENERK